MCGERKVGRGGERRKDRERRGREGVSQEEEGKRMAIKASLVRGLSSGACNSKLIKPTGIPIVVAGLLGQAASGACHGDACGCLNGGVCRGEVLGTPAMRGTMGSGDTEED